MMVIPINPTVTRQLLWFLGSICPMLQLESFVCLVPEKFMHFSTLCTAIVLPEHQLWLFLHFVFVLFAFKHCCALTGSVVARWDRLRYSLLYSTSYRQRSGAGLINTVQGHVWQVIVIAVTLDLPWRQAVVVKVCCEDMTGADFSQLWVVFLLLKK